MKKSLITLFSIYCLISGVALPAGAAQQQDPIEPQATTAQVKIIYQALARGEAKEPQGENPLGVGTEETDGFESGNTGGWSYGNAFADEEIEEDYDIDTGEQPEIDENDQTCHDETVCYKGKCWVERHCCSNETGLCTII